MIDCYVFGRKLHKIEFSHKNIAAALRTKKKIWLDMSKPSEERFAVLEKLFGLHPVTVEDCLTNSTRPKIEVFDDSYLFYVMYGIRRESGVKFLEIDMVLGERFLITSHPREISSINKLKKNPAKLSTLMHKGLGALFHHIIDVEIDKYFPLLERLDDEIEEVDLQTFQNPSREVLVKLNHLRGIITQIRRKVYRQRDKLIFLTRPDTPFLSDDIKHYFRDVYDNSVRVADFVDTQKDAIVGTLDTYLSLNSNRMNEIMRVLTIMATMMMPLTVVSSIYGMNFKNMPELQWEYGYFIVLGCMALMIFGMVAFFRRKRWL